MNVAAWVLLLGLGVTAGAHDAPFADELAQLRTHAGQAVPRWDPALAAVSLDRARELAAEGRLSHQDSRGRGPGMQSVTRGLPPGEYGEVLGVGASAEAVWRAWLASPTHRAVLTEPTWATWASASFSTEDTTVWVVRFWRP